MPTGTMTTYKLTEGVKLDFEPMIHQLNPFDVPFQGGSTMDGRLVLPTGGATQKKIEWHDDAILTPRSTLAATATTGGTVLTVASGAQINFQTGDLLVVNGEYIYVTAYGNTADTLETTRGIDGVAATTLPSGADVLIVGQYLAEGSDPPAARAIDRVGHYNMTQIFGPTKVHTSGTEQVIDKYGLEGTNEHDYQAAQRIKEQAIQLEQAILYGVRKEDTGAGKRAMGGLEYFITTNVDSATTALIESKLLDIMQASFNYGGAPDVIVSGAKQKRIISGFTSGGVIDVARADGTAGRKITIFESDFGT
ncbi:MAG: hypothetical protein FJ038_03935, partial [Chloroflexi bacterium]|nr:hypothetical protein [Chloroflexota bacterium]